MQDILIYYGTWLFPSSTPIYALLHEKYGWGRLKSYFIACIVAATIMFPIEKYVFQK